MTTSVTSQTQGDSLSVLTNPNQNCENLLLEHLRLPAGEASCLYSNEYTIFLALASRPIKLLQIREGKTHQGMYSKGDLSLIAAEMPLFAQWQGEDEYLQIRIAARFIQQVAREALELDSDRLELLSVFQTRDPHLDAIALMLWTELQQGGSANKLYIDSLANVLAVHLIRQYTATQPALPVYAGGLPQHQLKQVLEYMHDHLDQDIKLSDLAALLSMSQFHFSHQFKQAMGITPYQYLLQQRIERAKQLLKQSDRSISDIALQCGFNSHSHLSKQFRQLTGMTPKAYRLH